MCDYVKHSYALFNDYRVYSSEAACFVVAIEISKAKWDECKQITTPTSVQIFLIYFTFDNYLYSDFNSFFFSAVSHILIKLAFLIVNK